MNKSDSHYDWKFVSILKEFSANTPYIECVIIVGSYARGTNKVFPVQLCAFIKQGEAKGTKPAFCDDNHVPWRSYRYVLRLPGGHGKIKSNSGFGEALSMNVKKTQEYYKRLRLDDLCRCAYCQNYIRQIKYEYPAVSEYLRGLGVDIEKPFETMPLEPDQDGYITYIAAQYVVYGERRGFKKAMIDPVSIDIAEYHPSSKIEEPHFIIEICPILLKWVM